MTHNDYPALTLTQQQCDTVNALMAQGFVPCGVQVSQHIRPHVCPALTNGRTGEDVFVLPIGNIVAY